MAVMKMKKYEGILKRVREVEEKRGISYVKTDGKLYKGIKIVHIISAVWALIMNSLFLISLWINFGGSEKMVELQGIIITVSVCSVLIIAAMVLNKLKIYIVGAVLSVIPSVLLILTFGRELSDVLGFWGFKPVFYWRHLIPLALAIITMVWLLIIALRERVKTDKLYKKVTAGLYETFSHKADATEVSDEEWEEFLKTYNS